MALGGANRYSLCGIGIGKDHAAGGIGRQIGDLALGTCQYLLALVLRRFLRGLHDVLCLLAGLLGLPIVHFLQLTLGGGALFA